MSPNRNHPFVPFELRIWSCDVSPRTTEPRIRLIAGMRVCGTRSPNREAPLRAPTPAVLAGPDVSGRGNLTSLHPSKGESEGVFSGGLGATPPVSCPRPRSTFCSTTLQGHAEAHRDVGPLVLSTQYQLTGTSASASIRHNSWT